MRFFCIYKPQDNPAHAPPNPEQSAAVGRLIQEWSREGVLLATEGFVPSPKDVRVRLDRGKFTVTDGPFTEAKELIGGFALIEVGSRDEAVARCKIFLESIGGGESEIHELCDAPDLPIEKVGR